MQNNLLNKKKAQEQKYLISPTKRSTVSWCKPGTRDRIMPSSVTDVEPVIGAGHEPTSNTGTVTTKPNIANLRTTHDNDSHKHHTSANSGH